MISSFTGLERVPSSWKPEQWISTNRLKAETWGLWGTGGTCTQDFESMMKKHHFISGNIPLAQWNSTI